MGLLANVSAVLIARPDDAVTEEISDALRALFEDVLVIEAAPRDVASGETALRELVAGLSGAREERVLVVRPVAGKPTPHLWLGLTAYPERDVVTVAAAASATAAGAAGQQTALYRRERVLAEATARLRAMQEEHRTHGDSAPQTPVQVLESLNAALDTLAIEGADLAPLCEADT